MNRANTIAVTGSSGFLGRHLLQSLSQDEFNVLEISRKQGFDILSKRSMEELPPFQALVHLAAQIFVPSSYDNPEAFFSTNIVGTLNCLELAKKNRARIIFASSYLYGQPLYLPIDENHPTVGWNPYATSKIIGENLCQSYAQEFGLDLYVLRIFNIYGEGQSNQFVVPTIIEGLRSGKLRLQTSTPRRDFVYVKDVVEAIIKCVKAKKEGTNIYNIGFGQSYSVRDVVDICSDMMCSKVIPIYDNIKRKNEVMNVVADISKIKNELSWTPRYDLDTGLEEMVNGEIR